MPLLNSLGEKKYFCLSAVGNLKQFLQGLIHEFLHLKGEKKKHLPKGVEEREHDRYISQQISLPSQFQCTAKPDPALSSSGKVPFSWTSSSKSRPSFVVIATLWITKDIGFHQTSISIWLFMASALWQWVAEFLTKRILGYSATPHFSPHSSFMILMSVFSGNTHFTF